MNEIKACGIVLCALIVCVIFKRIKEEYSLLIRIVVAASVFTVSISILYPVLTYISEISEKTPIKAYIPTLFKALGIAFSVQITADICKDAGEGSLAEKITLFGRAEILIISLPLVKSLFTLAESLLE